MIRRGKGLHLQAARLQVEVGQATVFHILLQRRGSPHFLWQRARRYHTLLPRRRSLHQKQKLLFRLESSPRQCQVILQTGRALGSLILAKARRGVAVVSHRERTIQLATHLGALAARRLTGTKVERPAPSKEAPESSRTFFGNLSLGCSRRGIRR